MTVKSKASELQLPTWHTPGGVPLSCREKIKVLNENLKELQEMAQDALEDAVIMGADEDQVRETLHQLVESLANPYKRRNGA